MLQLEAGFASFGGKRLKFLSYTLNIHALQDVGTKRWKERHYGERNVLLVLLKPSSETGSDTVVRFQTQRISRQYALFS